jgi:hypothetical protein
LILIEYIIEKLRTLLDSYAIAPHAVVCHILLLKLLPPPHQGLTSSQYDFQ